jgi:hypothetical protein
MHTVRRIYIYLVSAISLQSVAWAAITLLRDLLAPGTYTSIEGTALQIALIVIGLPIFVGHWLWAQRLARREVEERESVLRRLYLYGVLAGFLGPLVANAFDLLDGLLRWIFQLGPQDAYRYLNLSPTGIALYHLAAMAVLALLWLYHRRVLAADRQALPETERAATVRRLYVYGLSAAGLAMTALAIVYLLRWLISQGGGGGIALGYSDLSRQVARLAVGLALWLVFWTGAQRRFAAPDDEERASVLRKLYLYLAVFAGVLAAVTASTVVLAALLRRLLQASSPGGSGDIREALSIIVGAVLVWAYHAYVLRRDVALAGEQPAGSGVRRLYLYLVAHVGLAAFLIGLGGNVSVLIRWLSGARFVSGLGGEVAWFSAALIAGLPVWGVPWRPLQGAAAAPGPAGDEESRAIVRKIYLYFYLFLATVTALSSGVYIISRLIARILGGPGADNLLSDMGTAIAFSLIAVGVWLYHGLLLRGDGRRIKQVQREQLAPLRVTVVDAGDGSLGRALLDELRRQLPAVSLQPLGLTPAAAGAMGAGAALPDVPALLAQSDLIVGPWTIAVAGAAGGAVTASFASAVTASPAHKLLVPLAQEGWEWVGVDPVKTKGVVRKAVRAVRQLASGEGVQPAQRLDAGAIAAIVVGALVMLAFFVMPLVFFFEQIY